MTCPDCERNKYRAALWRAEAYKQAGHDVIERKWIGLTDEEYQTMTDKELMQLALYALGLAKSSHNMVLSSDPPQSAWRYYDVDMKLQETITALDKRLAQPEQETGNLLKDAYNAMVEKKTRSQKLREAGFTRRPKGWEKEKDEQEPVAHTLNCVCGAVWDVRFDGVEEMVHAPTPPQRKPLTLEQQDAIVRQASENDWHDYELIAAVEAAHGIKP